MEWSISYNEPFVVCRSNNGAMNEVLLSKITHIRGDDDGAGSAYSYLMVEGGESIRVMGKSNEIAEVLKGFYPKKQPLEEKLSDDTESKLNILKAFVAAGIQPQKICKTMRNGVVLNMDLTLTFSQEERYAIIGELHPDSAIRSALSNGDKIL